MLNLLFHCLLNSDHTIWTDWIQTVVAIIGSGFAIGGYLSLLKDGKDKQKQINELSKQTQEFQNQTELQGEFLKLYRQQIDIQREAILSNKDSKEELKEIEKKRRVLDIKPHVKVTRPSGGKDVYTYEIEVVKNSFSIISTKNNDEAVQSKINKEPDTTVNPNDIIIIRVINYTRKSNHNYSFIINVNDEDGNPYQIIIKGQFGQYSILRLSPIEIKPLS